jgi:hypothetical protein
MEDIFQTPLETIDNLMKDQIHYAMRDCIQIDKIVLSGGFGDSPALRERLTKSLKAINEKGNMHIKLIFRKKNAGAAGVAKGALMRAMNKDNGPKRTPVQSIGILHHVRDDPRYPKEVLNQGKWEHHEETDDWYIMNTIEWLIKVASLSAMKSPHKS